MSSWFLHCTLYVLLLLSRNLVIEALGIGVALLTGAWPGPRFCWQHTSFFKMLAKTMAFGMLRPGCFRSFHTACSTFSSCVARFFDMLGSCLYWNRFESKMANQVNPSHDICGVSEKMVQARWFVAQLLDTKMTSDNSSPTEWCDRQVNLYGTRIYTL